MSKSFTLRSLSLSALLLCFVCYFSLGLSAQSIELQLLPSKDATLIEDENGGLTNGKGNFLFVGKNSQGSIRRTLLHFAVADSLPEGAIIDSVHLKLAVDKTNTDVASNSELYRVSASWTEGLTVPGGDGGGGATAAEGDLTWLHRERPHLLWNKPGGDFDSLSSAVASLGGVGTVTWSSAQMAQEVQGWLADSTQNFGWIILGDESTNRTTRRFHAREGDSETKPTLLIYFRTQSVSVADELSPFSKLRLFPNPSQGSLQLALETTSAEAIHAEFINIIGQAVYQVRGLPKAGVWNQALDLSILPSGVYFVKIQQGNQLSVRRWIKK